MTAQAPQSGVSVIAPTDRQGVVWDATSGAWKSASTGTHLGNGTAADFNSFPNVRNISIDYIQPTVIGGTIPGTLVQGHALLVKYFGVTTGDSQQADSSGVFLVDSLNGVVPSPTLATVGNESDAVNQGWNLRGYGTRLIGHIAKAQAQNGTGTLAGQPGIIDYAYGYSAASQGSRDAGCIVRQHAQYFADDQTAGSSGSIGAAWSVYATRSIHTQDALTVAGYTGTEGCLSTNYAIGVTSIVLETGQGASGLKGGAFPGSGTVQIDVGSLTEFITYTISGDTLTLGATTKNAHAKYARVAVVDANSGGGWRMVTGILTAIGGNAAIVGVGQLQASSGVVINSQNGGGVVSYIKQTTSPSAPSASRVIHYANASGQVSFMASDGVEHHQVGAPLEEILLAGLGFRTWNFPWKDTSGGTAPTAGTIYVAAMPVRGGQLITHLDFLLSTAGAGTAPTHIFVGLCDSTGKMLAQSNDLAASGIWTTPAIAQAALSATYTPTADQMCYSVILQVGSWGTTQMALGKALNGTVPGGIGTVLWGTAGTAQTALPATGSSLAITSTTPIAFWAGAD